MKGVEVSKEGLSSVPLNSLYLDVTFAKAGMGKQNTVRTGRLKTANRRRRKQIGITCRKRAKKSYRI